MDSGGAQLALGLGIVGIALGSGSAAAEQDGIDSTLYFEGTVGCGSPTLGEDEELLCHSEFENELVSVEIDGPSVIDETVGVGAFTVSTVHTLPDMEGAGVNILIDAASSTSNCELDEFPTPSANQLVLEGPVLSHRDAEDIPPLGSLGVYSYEFLLINCSTPGSVRILAAMNVYNFDGESTGEAWNKTEMTVTVPEPAGAGTAAAAALAGAALACRRRRS